MKSRFSGLTLGSLFLLVLWNAGCSSTEVAMVPKSSPIQLNTSSETYYYTDDDRKIASYESEAPEGNAEMHFRYHRNPASIAKELAQDEIRQGNICLNQLESDLEQAVYEGKVETLCATVFQDRLKDINRFSEKKSPLKCNARVEVEKNKSSIQLQFELLLNKSVPNNRKLYPEPLIYTIGDRNDTPDTTDQILDSYKVNIGEASSSWKTLLKNGACSVGYESLVKIQGDFLTKDTEQKKLAYCQLKQEQRVFQLSKMQERFKEYIPDEWFASYDKKLVSTAFEKQNAETYSSYKECKKSYSVTMKKLEKMAFLSRKIAKEHKLPTLYMEGFHEGRKPSSFLDISNEE